MGGGAVVTRLFALAGGVSDSMKAKAAENHFYVPASYRTTG